MKILCIDTSSKFCNIAIMEDKKLIKKIEQNNGLTHSETLMPLIKDILLDCNINLRDIDLLVVDVGPGSFTGIRIGIATAKAFADSLNIPCVGINSLEILAYNIKNEGLICSTIDCKNNNCYFSLYELIDGNYNVVEEPCAMSVEDVLSLLNQKYNNQSITFVGDGISSKSISNNLDVTNLGIAGFNKYKANNVGEDIIPMYLKKPQAEKQLEEKFKN